MRISNRNSFIIRIIFDFRKKSSHNARIFPDLDFRFFYDANWFWQEYSRISNQNYFIIRIIFDFRKKSSQNTRIFADLKSKLFYYTNYFWLPQEKFAKHKDFCGSQIKFILLYELFLTSANRIKVEKKRKKSHIFGNQLIIKIKKPRKNAKNCIFWVTN